MTVFSSQEQAEKVFEQLFSILAADENFTGRLRQSGLILKLNHSKPDVELTVSADGVNIGPDPAGRKPSITISFSCDSAHKLWLGQLLVPVAMATGKMRIRGGVSKVLEIVPLLQPAFDQYPAIAAEAGLPV
jgi:putative sterol carrier protein